MLTERAFWQIIGRSRTASGGDKKAQREFLVKYLGKRDDSTLRDFDQMYFDRRMDAYRCDIWDVVSLLSGGCGDDSFSDFMDWLVACGKRIYSDVLQNPETLLKHEEAIDFDEMYFGTVAKEALAARRNIDIDDLDQWRKLDDELAPGKWPKNPAGRFAKRTRKTLWKRYPSVCKRLEERGELESALDG